MILLSQYGGLRPGLHGGEISVLYHSANSPSAHVRDLNHDHRQIRVCFGVFYYIIIALSIPIIYSRKNNTMIQISFLQQTCWFPVTACVLSGG